MREWERKEAPPAWPCDAVVREDAGFDGAIADLIERIACTFRTLQVVVKGDYQIGLPFGEYPAVPHAGDVQARRRIKSC